MFIEYSFEYILKVMLVDDDFIEVKLEILDISKLGFGVEMICFCCEVRIFFIIVFFNCMDDINGIGIFLLFYLNLLMCVV